MSRHLSTKIFAASVGVFALVLMVQWLFISGSFNALYEKSLLSSMQTELHSTVRGFTGKGSSALYEPLADYTLQTGSPILVLTEDGQIVNSDFLSCLRTLSVHLPTGGTAIVPIGYLYDIYGDNSPYIGVGRRFDMELVRVGESNIYEPLNIATPEQNYRNRTSISLYGDAAQTMLPDIAITDTNALRQEVSMNTSRAEFILARVAQGLIGQEDPDTFLKELCRDTITEGDFEYSFLYDSVYVSGTHYYFVTAQRLVVTGYEQAYLNRVFAWIYAIAGAILIIAAAFLSHAIARPLKELNSRAQRIARMDFSQRVGDGRKDEIGQLSDSINMLSDNLQVAMNTLTEANTQLQESSVLAQKNEDRMKRLLSELAHEFKTPLGIISGYMEAIQMGLCKEDPERAFRIIDREIENLTFMVDEAIELTRLQSGNWKIEVGNHNLSDILAGVQEVFTRKLSADSYTFVVEDCYAVVQCDAHRINQVICNFISNAFKYADERKYIRIYETYDDANVIIHVENSGTLPDGDASRIWEREYFSDQTERTHLPSQGIGLDIVKSILNAHGSIFGVTSGNGLVTFSFSLKIVK